MSLVLCVATAAIIIRSQFHFDEYMARSSDASTRALSDHGFGWDEGRIFVWYYDMSIPQGHTYSELHMRAPYPWMHHVPPRTGGNPYSYRFWLWTFEKGGPGVGHGMAAGSWDRFYQGGFNP
jgi:hypothetical protein